MCLPLKTLRVVVLWLCAVAAIWLAPSASYANPTSLGEVAASGPILLPTPPLDGEVWIEIGTVDVTAFAEIDGDQIRLAGFAPLERGPHLVTIHAVNGDNFDVIATFTVTVNAQAKIDHSGVLTITSQTDEDAEGTVADVVGELTAQSANGRLEADMTYQGSTDPLARLNGRAVDLQDYQLALRFPAGTGQLTTRSGHHSAGPGSLLLDDQQRRGVSTGFSRSDDRFSFDVFFLRASPILGRDDILGLNNRDDRITGLRSTWQPSAATDFTLAFEVYEGRGETYFAEGIGSGEGVAASIAGSARAGTLRYGASVAHTGWDDDAEGGTFDTLSGNAFTGFLEYDLSASDSDTRLTARIEASLVDYYYFSLANPFEATGIERYAFGLERNAPHNWQRFSYSVQTDARNAPDVVPQNRIREVSFDGQWSPPAREGTLALTYGVGYLIQDRLFTPEFGPLPQDYAALTAYVGLSGGGDRTSWFSQLTYIDEDDRSGTNADRTSISLDFSLSHAFSPNVSTDATVSLTQVEQSDGPDWSQTDVSVGLNWDPVPNTWRTSLGLNATFTDEPFVDDGASIVLATTYSLTEKMDIEFSATREIGSFARNGKADTTAALTFRVTF